MKGNTKGQIGLSDGPTLVMIVGFVFLMMATIAYISNEYQAGFSTNTDVTVTNESGFYLNGTTWQTSYASLCNFGTFAVTTVHNASDGYVLTSGNWTASATAGTIVNASTAWPYDLNVSYTYSYNDGAACNVTTNLQSELDSNTSIAGIILTISLVGIVLSILIGIFVASRRRGF